MAEDDDDAPVCTIECVIGGRARRMVVGDACGLRLQVHDRDGVYLVGEEQALDRREFVRAWRQRSRGTYAWEDGTPFDMGGEQ